MLTRHVLLCTVALALFSGCAHFALEDCPDGVLGDDSLPRLRTSHYRVQLADPAAAARRFLPYALMSAYAYRDGPSCNADSRSNRVSDEDAKRLIERLSATTPPGSPWKLVPELGLPNDCEDELGLMFNVWTRQAGNKMYVVIAFRGTSGIKDWAYGNLWWFTRFANNDNQITRARGHADRVIKHFKAHAASQGGMTPRFVSTGHSLGGGLAQHLVYAYPDDVEQAIAFDPSSVTGFVDVGRDRQQAGCACRDSINPEARLIRIYESYEILANLRIFHKLLFLPERHVQEVRFPFERSWNPLSAHSIQTFASNMYTAADGSYVPKLGERWYAAKEAKDAKDAACTKKLVEGQEASCRIAVDEHASMVCPQ